MGGKRTLLRGEFVQYVPKADDKCQSENHDQQAAEQETCPFRLRQPKKHKPGKEQEAKRGDRDECHNGSCQRSGNDAKGAIADHGFKFPHLANVHNGWKAAISSRAFRWGRKLVV